MWRSRYLVPLFLTILILIVPNLAHAWNYTGHRVIASVAYRQLDDQTKKRITEVLRKHPCTAPRSHLGLGVLAPIDRKSGRSSWSWGESSGGEVRSRYFFL
jgi:hypothetical protein